MPAGLDIMNSNGRMNGDARGLLRYLPTIYDDSGSDDVFMANFLRIFETLWEPLDRQIDQLYAYFDPRLAPAEFLPWLSQWVDMTLDMNLAPTRQRELLRAAVDLYQRRGTVGALTDYLRIYLGVEPRILDELDEQGEDLPPFHFLVILPLSGRDAQDRDLEQRVRRIIDEEKPAHTTYTLKIDAA